MSLQGFRALRKPQRRRLERWEVEWRMTSDYDIRSGMTTETTPPPQGEDREPMPWRELLTDKAIDVILIPLGLFAALWFQGWVDDKKEQSDYVEQLDGFRGEIAENLRKGQAMASQIGALDVVKGDEALGPLGAVFPQYDAVMAYNADLVECLQILNLPPPKAPSAEALAELAKTEEGRAEIQASIDEGQAREERMKGCDAIISGTRAVPEVSFQVVDLSPLYRYEVWQMYLQDGIKLFKDEAARRVGRKLGEAYALAKEVEQRVAEIEELYNAELVARLGAERALEAEVHHLLEVKGGTEDPAQRFGELAAEARRARYSMLSFEESLATRVARLKSFVSDMAARFTEVDKAVADEVARNQ